MNGDASYIYRVESFLMEYLESCICKFSHLIVSDLCDREGILNDVGVNGVDIINVCPVLIYFGINCTCEDGTCDIGSASGECDDLTFLAVALETGEDT